MHSNQISNFPYPPPPPSRHLLNVMKFFKAVLPESVYKGIQGGAHTLGPGVYPGWAILAEGILTFLLVFTVLLTAVDEENSSLAPLAIGFAVAVDIIAGYS